MKKTLVVFSLVLFIAVSVIAGTLAMYTTTIDEVASGSVVAKEFVLMGNETQGFTENVKIAPTETKTWKFNVKNFNDNVVSETAMDLDFTVGIAASTGKTAIAPLVVTVKNEAGNVVATKTGTGTVTFEDEFTLDTVGQTHEYTVEITWPSNNEIDIDYAGASYGSAVSISVTGTQK